MELSLPKRIAITVAYLVLVLVGMALGFVAIAASGVAGGIMMIPVCMVAHGCSILKQRFRPEEPLPLVWWGWTCVIAGLGLVWLWWDVDRTSRRPPYIPPSFASLQQTTGVLRKGLGNDRTITTRDGRQIEIICAGSSGRASRNGCLYEREANLIGKEVTIFHTPVFRTGTLKTRYFEMRQNGSRIVHYEQIAEHKKYQDVQRRKSDRDITILFTAAWLYGAGILVYRWSRARRTRQNNITAGYNKA